MSKRRFSIKIVCASSDLLVGLYISIIYESVVIGWIILYKIIRIFWTSPYKIRINKYPSSFIMYELHFT